MIPNAGSWSRDLHNQWVCFVLSELEPFVQPTEINSMDFVLPSEQHVPAIIPQNNMLYIRAAAALEGHFSKHEYLVDDPFSAADIVLA